MSKKILLLLGLTLLFVVYFLLSVPYYSGDVKNHLVWGRSILTEGTLGFYGREFHDYAFPNYPPAAMGLFAFSTYPYQVVNDLVWFLNVTIPIFPSNLVGFFQWENVEIAFLKLPAIIANFGIAMILYLLTKRLWAGLLFLLNPAAIYLSVVWGQIDLLPVFFFLLALLLLFREKKFLSVFFVALALLSKQTIIIFLPVFLWIFLKKHGPKSLGLGLGVILAVFYLVYLPFHKISLTWPFQLYKLNFSLVAPSVSENAINLWGVLFGFQRAYDGDKFLLLSYQHWGYLAFLLSMAFPLLVFLKKKVSLKAVYTFLFLVTAVYFLTLTRMHERYLAGVTVFLTYLVTVDKRYIPGLIFFSVIHTINLYRGLYQPDMPWANYLVSNNWLLNGLVAGYSVTLVYYLRAFGKHEA